MFSRKFLDRHRKNKTAHRDSISVWYVFLSIVHSFTRISCGIYSCRIYRISFLYAIQYTQIDIRISPIRLDFRLRFAICSVRRENPIISTDIEKKWLLKNIRNLCLRVFVLPSNSDIVTASSLPHAKGTEQTGALIIPGTVQLREKVPNGFSLTGTGRYFRGNLDRDKAESTQLLEKHNTWEIFAKKLGVTRFEGIAFERRRKYRFPKAVLQFSLYPRVSRALDRSPPSKRRSFYLTSNSGGMFRIGRTDPRRPCKRVLRKKCF